MGSKGKEGTKDISMILNLSGVINRARKHRAEAGLGVESTSLILNALSSDAECICETSARLLETQDLSAAKARLGDEDSECLCLTGQRGKKH